MGNLVVIGYGPPGLIERAKECRWQSCADGGQNFNALNLAGYCLCRPSDEGASLGVKICIRDGMQDATIEGFCFPNAVREVGLWSQGSTQRTSSEPVGLADVPLVLSQDGSNPTRYEITIEAPFLVVPRG